MLLSSLKSVCFPVTYHDPTGTCPDRWTRAHKTGNLTHSTTLTTSPILSTSPMFSPYNVRHRHKYVLTTPRSRRYHFHKNKCSARQPNYVPNPCCAARGFIFIFILVYYTHIPCSKPAGLDSFPPLPGRQYQKVAHTHMHFPAHAVIRQEANIAASKKGMCGGRADKMIALV